MFTGLSSLDLRCAGFSPAFSHTHASILVSGTSSGHRHPPSQACGTLSYHSHCCESTTSVTCLVPIIFGAGSLDQ